MYSCGLPKFGSTSVVCVSEVMDDDGSWYFKEEDGSCCYIISITYFKVLTNC